MTRTMLMILALCLSLITAPALADPGFEGCTVKEYEDKAGPFTPLHMVTANMTLKMKQPADCEDYAISFTVKLTGTINTTITCNNRQGMFLGVGNTYSCTTSTESLTRKFNWMMLGTREQTCSILANWVRDKGGYL